MHGSMATRALAVGGNPTKEIYLKSKDGGYYHGRWNSCTNLRDNETYMRLQANRVSGLSPQSRSKVL